MKSGQFVEWDSSGGTARGKIVQIVRNGDVPNIDAKITGTPEEPAARIQVYRKDSDGNYEPTDTFVGHKITELRSIKSLASEEELNLMQRYLIDTLITGVEYIGMFDKGIGGQGAHYIPAEKNVFASEGIACKNCVFFASDSGTCSIVKGEIEENAACKFWIIEEYELGLAPEPMEDDEEDNDEDEMSMSAQSSWRVSGARNLELVEDEAWDGDAAKASIFALAGFDTDSPKPEIARRGFLVYDSSEPTLKGSYKLPFAIVRNGRLVASTAGIRAAASRLPQTDIPTNVMESARRIIDAYQQKSAKSEKYSGIDFSPPDGVKSAARRGLELHEKGLSGGGLEPATVAWARKYVNGDNVSPERARMGNRFFGRNARFANAPKDSPAWVSWLLWGGGAGKAWFSSLVRQMDNADKKSTSQSASMPGFLRLAETSGNPLLKEVELVLTDFEANANKEGIPLSEKDNIIRTALHTPLKIAASESSYGGHKGATPIGPITEVYEDTYEGRPVIKAKAKIWSDEFKEVYSLLKSEAGEREYIGTSWEVYYSAADDVDGVSWLKNVTFAGTCIVDSPAYGERTKLLKVAETQKMEELQKELQDLQEVLAQKESELDGLRKQNEAYKEADERRAEAEKRQNVKIKLVHAGFSEAEISDKLDFYMQLPDEAFDTIVADFISKRSEASTKSDKAPVIPEFVQPTNSYKDPKALAEGLKKLLKNK